MTVDDSEILVASDAMAVFNREKYRYAREIMDYDSEIMINSQEMLVCHREMPGNGYKVSNDT